MIYLRLVCLEDEFRLEKLDLLDETAFGIASYVEKKGFTRRKPYSVLRVPSRKMDLLDETVIGMTSIV